MSAALQGPSERILLETPVLTIGRAPDNQLVLSDGKASTHHALIQMHQPNPLLFDLDSTNGTFVNNFRLVSRVPYPLRPGDSVRIGDTVYIFEQDDPEATKRATPSSVKQPDQTTYDPTIRPKTPGPVVSPLQTPQLETPPYAPQSPSGASFPPGALPSPERSLWSSATSSDVPQMPFPQSPSWGPVPDSGAPLLQSPPWGSVPVDPAAPTSPYVQSPIAPSLYGPPGGVQPPQNGRTRRSSKTLIIVATVILLALIGGSFAAYMLALPRPTMTISSAYNAGNVAVGSTGTSLKISGHKFSSASTITFLLDGKPISGEHTVQSNGSGDVSTTLQLTDNWPLGRHVLTAKDASGYTTNQGAAIQVVKQGEANTPGPNGAPPDDASLTINASVTVNGNPVQATETLTVTGRPDPNGGTVCIAGDDNGQPHTVTGSSDNVTFRETLVLSCSGLYKNGKLTYTETATSDKIEFSNGLTCTARTPYTYQHLTGTFSNATTINGTFTQDTITYDCSNGVNAQQLPGNQGTWTGQTVQGGTTNQNV
jgi:pSer/pThr/pTyr-binding forkhead associated (FHA) protein